MSLRLPFDGAAFAAGDPACLTAACSAPALPAFSPRVLALLDALSQSLRALPQLREYPDLAAFAFWCRPAALSAMGGAYEGEMLVGRGLSLHLAPGNVALSFAYSLAAGLLAGNPCVVRLPGERFPQSGLLCACLDELTRIRFADLRPYALCLRCGHDSPLLEALSVRCAVRVIWGGDETVAHIRRLPLPARAVELTFADRRSVCVLDSAAWLAAPDKDALAGRFCRDAYWSDQLACTAPRAVLWLGERAGLARADFWPRVSALARQGYPMADALAVRKREAALLVAASYPGAVLCPGDNYAVRVGLPELTADSLDFCPGGGFFVERAAATLDALLPVAGERCQTVVSYGVSRAAYEEFFAKYGPGGIDRVVPLGQSAEFSLRWDGYDLIRAMSRCVSLTPG